MPAARDTAWIVERARSIGFSLCGVAPASAFPELERLPEWLARGYAGQMNYLEDPRRASPALVMDGARSVVVCALLYNTAHPRTAEAAVQPSTAAAGDGSPRGWISRYAWGDDYHHVLREKLDRLVAAMRAEFSGPFEARAYVDTGPVLERVAAKHAGLGWLAKNTCLIHPELGSWLFLGVIVTTLDLVPSLGPGEAPQPDLCGQCTLCIDACPTRALVEPYVLDARRCISYLTIEHCGSPPEELRQAIGAHVFGCDICQDVCPYNNRAPVTKLMEFQPRSLGESNETRKSKNENRTERWADLCAPALEWLASLTEEQYQQVFCGSAMKRAKYQGLVRNACVALGNAAPRLTPTERERVRALLARLSASPDAVIAEQAAWALARMD
jgi:epoxyqueuosine reductase